LGWRVSRWVPTEHQPQHDEGVVRKVGRKLRDSSNWERDREAVLEWGPGESENLLWRHPETETEERVSHAETRQNLKELIVAKEGGVSPKDVIEVGGERDTNIKDQAQPQWQSSERSSQQLAMCTVRVIR
jgi:hypothetical protein